MAITIKDVFDEQFKDVKFDAKMCRRIIKYSQHFMTRNEDHSKFFGGVLMGVNPIKFFDSDREEWYDEVLEVDESLLMHGFRQCKAINFEFNVMSDVFNYTPIYIAYRLDKEKGISPQLKKEAQIHAFMVLHYRFLTSLFVKRFKYPAKPEYARATYQVLTKRSDIKRFGSWRALLFDRSEDILSSGSIYRKTIQNFGPDPGLIRIVTDTQGRIRGVVNKIYVTYLEVISSGYGVKATSDMFVNNEGEMVLKDKSTGYSSYIRYINEVIPNRNSFIKDELIDVVHDAMNTAPRDMIYDTLVFLSDNYQAKQMGYLEEIVKEDLLYVFDFMLVNRNVIGRNQDIAGLISRVRSLLTASRSSDPAVLKLREQTERLVRNSVKTKTVAVIASVRTAVLLYIVVRTMTRSYYS